MSAPHVHLGGQCLPCAARGFADGLFLGVLSGVAAGAVLGYLVRKLGWL